MSPQLPQNNSCKMMELVFQSKLWKSCPVGHPGLVWGQALENSTM